MSLFTLLTTIFLVDPSTYNPQISLLHKTLFHFIHLVDRFYAWYKLPVFLGLAYLGIRRYLYEHYNLLNVARPSTGVISNPLDFRYRTADGKFNDPFNDETGGTGSFFGRNVRPSPQTDKMLDPHPSVVATKLLARRKLYDTGQQFNMLAAAWIQFMIHDWADHFEERGQVVIKAPSSVASQCPLKSFKFPRSKEIPTGFFDIPTGFPNRRTSWWDGSAIYGNEEAELKNVRTFKDGKLKLSDNGLLPRGQDGIPISGDIRNSWAGVSVLHALFIKEHNAICDQLQLHEPFMDDEDLYRHARLVTSAVIAKIHTIDWTIQLLNMDTLHAGMRANWYGLLGKKFKDRFGHTGSSILSGYVGMPKSENHGVPFSLTEEFVAVYRMHSLMPDNILVRDIKHTKGANETPPIKEDVPMPNLIGVGGEDTLAEIGTEAMLVSMGHQASGALTLWNYPTWMRDLIPQDVNGENRPDHVDLPAVEIYRDRERSIPRYNEFRRSMLMIPISRWEELTDDNEAIADLEEVYGKGKDGVEKLDLLVGLMAEKKIKGYAISETAFFIFLVMAPRRLAADRFFTSDFNEKVYTKQGLAWVNNTESLKDVLRRHYGEEVNKWLKASSAFSVWSAEPISESCIPIYLRTPK